MILRVRALILLDNYILLAGRADGSVKFFPGGRVEPGEGLLEALRRELYEETQGILQTSQYLGAVEARWELDGEPMHDLSHFFAVTCSGLDVRRVPLCPDTGIDLEWVHKDTLSEQPIMPHSLLPKLLKWLSGDQKTWWEVIA